MKQLSDLKRGDWVIANPKTNIKYEWGNIIYKDIPYQIHMIYHTPNDYHKGQVWLIANDIYTGPWDLIRFMPYNKYTNTKLLAGGNV